MQFTPRTEIVLSLFAPYSHLSRHESGLKRALRFEATFEDGSARLHFGDLIHSPRFETAVLFEQSDDAEAPGWVNWTEVEQREGQNESSIVRYMIYIPLERYAIDYADTFHSRGQKLILTLKIIANTDLVGTSNWHENWDVNRVNPQPVKFVALRFRTHHV